MELIIGRDANSQQLQIFTASQTKSFGVQGSVPMTVSRQHCKLTIDSNGSMRIHNLKMENETFVNGISIQNRQVTEKDKVELGHNRYVLDWNFVKAMVPATADIRPLKKIWDEYDKHRMELQLADR